MYLKYTELAEKWTFPAFQQTMAPSQGQGGQKYSECMKMSTQPRSGVVVHTH